MTYLFLGLLVLLVLLLVVQIARTGPARQRSEVQLAPRAVSLEPLAYPAYLVRRHADWGTLRFANCSCDLEPARQDWPEPTLHLDHQDTEAEGWLQLLELIDRAAADQREEFDPGAEIHPDAWHQVVTLPPSIGRLESVKHLILYGSALSRIPPEIGGMTSSERFEPYKSYRLHWFPYEITRCKLLKGSCVSTRALYGNYKHRPPFPTLPNPQAAAWSNGVCSVCGGQVIESTVRQAWISLTVGTDVLPLLVNACSDDCIEALPIPPEGYVRGSHAGGRSLRQPSAPRS